MPTRQSAIRFNGSSNYIAATSSPTNAVNNFWMAAWIIPAVLPQVAGMIMYNGNDYGGWGLAISNGGGLSGSRLTGLAGAVAWVNPGVGGDLVAGVKYHVAAIRRAGSWEFYLNGVLINNGNTTVPITPVTGRCTVGCGLNSANNPFRYFNGVIDAAMFGTGAPSATDMANLFKWGVRPAGCALDYEMDELTGTTIVDSSGNGNTGTLSSGTFVSDTTITISPFAPSFNP